MKTTIVLILGFVLLCGVMGVAFAGTITVDLPSTHLTTRTDGAASMGNYYLLDVPLPAAMAGARVQSAFLEFYVDATVTEAASGHDPAPRIQVYALKSAMGETFDVSKIEKGPGVASVPIGTSKRVGVIVTEVIQGWLDTPTSNHGLVVGALTGAQDGRFTLKSGVLGSGAMARLTVHYKP